MTAAAPTVDDRGLRIVAERLGFTEGPVVMPDGSIVVTSMTHGAVYRLCSDGRVKQVAEVGGGANGAAVDAEGTLYIAQSGGRWVRDGPSWPLGNIGGVQRIGLDGAVRWLSQDPISGNDICFGPDGLLYVTDPTKSTRLHDGRIWRVHPITGAAELVCSVPWFCNGLAFGPDDVLYVASTYEARIYAIDVVGDRVTAPRVVLDMVEGQPDGLAFDARGRLVIGAIDPTRELEGSVQTYALDGELLDLFRPGGDSHYANVAFDGRGGLVITSSDLESVLLAEQWGDAGLPLHPFR